MQKILQTAQILIQKQNENIQYWQKHLIFEYHLLFSIALYISDLQKIVVIFIVIQVHIVLTFGLKFGKRDLKNKASVFPS